MISSLKSQAWCEGVVRGSPIGGTVAANPVSVHVRVEVTPVLHPHALHVRLNDAPELLLHHPGLRLEACVGVAVSLIGGGIGGVRRFRAEGPAAPRLARSARSANSGCSASYAAANASAIFLYESRSYRAPSEKCRSSCSRLIVCSFVSNGTPLAARGRVERAGLA